MYHLFIHYAIYRKTSTGATYKGATELMLEWITMKNTLSDGITVEIEKSFTVLPNVTSLLRRKRRETYTLAKSILT